MALFKVLRGNRQNLPSERHDGWAYFCSDTGEFFIDYDTNTKDENGKAIIERKRIAGGAQIVEWESGDENPNAKEGES